MAKPLSIANGTATSYDHTILYDFDFLFGGLFDRSLLPISERCGTVCADNDTIGARDTYQYSHFNLGKCC